MRAAIAVVVVLLSSCATDQLSVNPPPGVDFSGKWKLNEADSDDPLHLLQAQNAASSKSQENNDGTGAGGRSGRRGSRGGPGTGYAGPPAPALGAMSAPLRWPGKNVEVKQVAGVVAFTSDGRNRVCQPNSEKKSHAKPDPPRPRFSAGWSRCSTLDVRLDGVHPGGHRRRSRRGGPSLSTRNIRVVGRSSALSGNSGFQRRPIQRLYPVTGLGSRRAMMSRIKKPGVSPAFKSPCLSTALFIAL